MLTTRASKLKANANEMLVGRPMMCLAICSADRGGSISVVARVYVALQVLAAGITGLGVYICDCCSSSGKVPTSVGGARM